MRFYYTLKTLEPVIVSKTTATTTNHQCLDHISGSAVLGLVASDIYPKQPESKDLTWSLFHSGEVQFGPCYPFIDGELSLPTPASWHFEKGESPVVNSRYQGEKITNHAKFERKEGVQYKQCRDGFVTGKGLAGEIKSGLSTKTALERKTGSAKEGQLFSYHYLQANQVFVGWVEYENEQQLSLIKTSLLGQRRIGRSRSAEFGLVEITETQQLIADGKPQAREQLILWCLSDCEIINQQGLPTFTPQLADLTLMSQFGDLSGRLNTEKSFIRTVSVSRFNQARAGIDSEQVLIAKGSILVFDDVSITPYQLELLESKGIGINRQQGLGWVKVNPDWAFEAQLSAQLFPSFKFVETQSEAKTIHPANSPLTRWLDAKIIAQQSNQSIEQEVTRLIDAILQAYSKLRSYNHISIRQDAGPSHTQWGRVREAIKSHKNDWKVKLFDRHDVKTSQAICKSVNDELGWGIRWYEGQGEMSFTEFSQALFQNTTHETMILTIERLSRYELCNKHELARARTELLGEKA